MSQPQTKETNGKLLLAITTTKISDLFKDAGYTVSTMKAPQESKRLDIAIVNVNVLESAVEGLVMMADYRGFKSVVYDIQLSFEGVKEKAVCLTISGRFTK